MKRAALVVNPFASGVTPELTREVLDRLCRVAKVETLETERPGHGVELVEALADVDAIFVFSGDGGFNEVVNGADGTVPIGFLPGGGTSVLSRVLGIPRDPLHAADHLADALHRGRTRRISLGRANGRRFTFSCGVGFDAEAVRRVDALGRSEDGRRAGDLAFALTLARILAEHRGRFEPALEIRGLGRAAFALVANSDPYTYAGTFPIHAAPRAELELGLDVVAPAVIRPANLARLLASVARGHGHEEAEDVLYGHDLDRVEIVCDRPLPYQVDGEDLGDVETVVCEAERDALDVFV